VAKGADELEVLCPCFRVFPNPTDIAILAAGGTICDPAGGIRNVSIDGYCHTSIIQIIQPVDRLVERSFRAPANSSDGRRKVGLGKCVLCFGRNPVNRHAKHRATWAFLTNHDLAIHNATHIRPFRSYILPFRARCN
jgi:hypothetical protein